MDTNARKRFRAKRDWVRIYIYLVCANRESEINHVIKSRRCGPPGEFRTLKGARACALRALGIHRKFQYAKIVRYSDGSSKITGEWIVYRTPEQTVKTV